MGYSNLTVAFDIETVGRIVTNAEMDYFRRTWKPKSNVTKEDTIARHKKEAEQDFVNKRALELGGAQIVSVAMCEIRDGKIEDMESCCVEDEELVVRRFATYINDLDMPARLVGYNSLAFDLMFLDLAFSRYDIALDYPLGSRGSVDLFKWPLNKQYSLKRIAHIFGIHQSPEVAGTSGGDVARLWDEQNYEKIRLYNEDDVRMTVELYFHLSRVWEL